MHIHLWMDFIIGGVAAMGAGLFTNPLEVAKTRMQLQGELLARGKYAVHYKNAPHALYTIAKNEGILAIQKGLVPGLWVQLFLNGFRLGTFQFGYSHGFMSDKDGKQVLWKTMSVSCVGAVLGAVSASPLFLVKTRLQSQSASEVAVGFQHKHTGMISAFQHIYKEHGVKGLFRGVEATIPRAAAGGTAQLTTFSVVKDWLVSEQIFTEHPIAQSFCASMVGGVVVAIVMTPFDVISTRLYNQGVDSSGRGLLYDGYFDCVMKIWRKERFYGFFKGIGPSYLRLGPHTVLCLVFWDELNKFYIKFNEIKSSETVIS
ncbi:solute carrier family 25 member 35-like isoform X2 [Chrysoperla carnea]|uniref:solute carrier family 25 member 35-like isoform X2 n=1 Tax=Chrysoperla carnea TaxID=189513 RepID=UPI001D063B19|nr:solute carrier family 25 member 35-like isoform X2 [Chrysoperla carnea]